MKLVELFGNAFLTGTATWALLVTKSSYQYDSLSYGFFLSVGVSRLLANIVNNSRVNRFTKSRSHNSLAFATALLSTEFCLVAGMDKSLASSNLILPLLNLLTKRKDDEKMLETARWYSAVLMLFANNAYDMKSGYLLTFILLLTNPKVSKTSPYLMAASIILAVPILNALKQQNEEPEYLKKYLKNTDTYEMRYL